MVWCEEAKVNIYLGYIQFVHPARRHISLPISISHSLHSLNTTKCYANDVFSLSSPWMSHILSLSHPLAHIERLQKNVRNEKKTKNKMEWNFTTGRHTQNEFRRQVGVASLAPHVFWLVQIINKTGSERPRAIACRSSAFRVLFNVEHSEMSM